MLSVKDAVLSSVLYADIFDYALTTSEIKTWLVFHKKRHFSRAFFDHVVVKSRDHIQYLVLPKRHRLIHIRKKRFMYSQDKWKRAVCVARFLRMIPTVLLVGVTGALAMNNAKRDDDIDIYIVVSPQTLWVSRFFVTLLVELLGIRRRPNDLSPVNKVCLNMYVTSTALSIPAKERDLFTAHEVLQMVPLWDKSGMYKKFLLANNWVKKFLPNAWEEKSQSSKLKAQNYNVKLKFFFIVKWFSVIVLRFAFCVLRLLEKPSRIAQLWYMKKRRSTEIVTDKVIRFHPRDARNFIKDALGRRLTRYKIPLDKIFYAR